MDVDEALGLLGKWGKWQVAYYVMLSVAVMFPASWHMLAIVYIGFKPDHRCKLDADANINTSIPLVKSAEGVLQYSSCSAYVNFSRGNETQPCQNGWEYLGNDGNTIVTEWDLVCTRDYWKDASQTVLVVGVMIGAMGFTALSDYVGRKPVFLFSQWAMIVVGVATAFINNFYVFAVFRFFTGMLQQGIILTGFVMACELFAAKYRTFAGIIIELFWATAWCLMPLMAYLFRNWRYFQLSISLFGLLTIPLFWLLPESVIWLYANNRIKEAEQIIRNAAKMNGITLPDNLLTSPTKSEGSQEEEEVKNGGFLAKIKSIKLCKRQKEEQPETARYTLLDVLRHRLLRMYAIIMSCLWMAVTLVYYGLSLSTAQLAGERYLNAFLSAFIEIPAYLSSFFILSRWGRRRPLIVYYIITGVALLLTKVIPEKTADGTSLTPLIVTFNMIGKFGITGAFGIVFLYAPEIFPTTVRSQALGIASLFGRLGNVLATYTAYVYEKVPWLPGPLFGILSVAAGLLVILLPETHNRPLPQTIQEVEQWSSKKKLDTEQRDEQELQPAENEKSENKLA